MKQKELLSKINESLAEIQEIRLILWEVEASLRSFKERASRMVSQDQLQTISR
jgi:hypothetical protein